MKKLLLILLFPTLAFAEDLTVFQAGDIATAAAFNKNFQILDDRITSNTHPAAACEPFNALLDIDASYVYADSAVGSEVTLGSTDYRIVKIPIADIATGDTFHLTYPAKGTSLGIWTNATKWPPNTCIDLMVSGYPAYIHSGISNSTTKSSYSDLAYNKHQVNFYLYVLVGNQLLNLNVQQTKETEFKPTIGTNDYDLTDDLSVEFFTPDALEAVFDDFIDHIKIEKAP